MVLGDELSRSVYVILGVPIDSVDIAGAVHAIEVAAEQRTQLFVSTPNLNFLVASQTDAEFRETLLSSDLCLADGAPVLWIARMLGLPIETRTPGSDIFVALKRRPLKGTSEMLSVFFFGGQEGAGETACRRLNAEGSALSCTGWYNPGFGTVEEMSSVQTLDKINSSNADILVAALGAHKGQLWLHRNRMQLTPPVLCHLGAVINFQAGTVKRAPPAIRRFALEWLWRIKEEPALWLRYLYDGAALLRLLATRLVPLALLTYWQRHKWADCNQHLTTRIKHEGTVVRLQLAGVAGAQNASQLRASLRETVMLEKTVVLDFGGLEAIDPALFGLFILFRKQLRANGYSLKFDRVSRGLQRFLRLSSLGFLLED